MRTLRYEGRAYEGGGAERVVAFFD